MISLKKPFVHCKDLFTTWIIAENLKCSSKYDLDALFKRTFSLKMIEKETVEVRYRRVLGSLETG